MKEEADDLAEALKWNYGWDMRKGAILQRRMIGVVSCPISQSGFMLTVRIVLPFMALSDGAHAYDLPHSIYLRSPRLMRRF